MQISPKLYKMKFKIQSTSNSTTAKIHQKPRKDSNSVDKIQHNRVTKNQKPASNLKHIHQITQEPSTSQQSPSTLQQSPSTTQQSPSTTEMIGKMKYQEQKLKEAVTRAAERNQQDRRTYKNLIRYYEGQQRILDERCEMTAANCHSYRALVMSMQNVIITLRTRLHAFHAFYHGNDEESENEEEGDEGYCEKIVEIDEEIQVQ